MMIVEIIYSMLRIDRERNEEKVQYVNIKSCMN